MIPVTHSNSKVHVESGSTRWPAKNVSENDFSRCRTGEEVFRPALICDRIGFPDGFEEASIYVVMFDF